MTTTRNMELFCGLFITFFFAAATKIGKCSRAEVNLSQFYVCAEYSCSYVFDIQASFVNGLIQSVKAG